MDASLKERLIGAGERFSETVRYTREEIIRFAGATRDTNPLHHDTESAQRSRFGEIIASGQQTSAIMMGLLASHYSRDDDGIRREMVCLNFNFAFKAPVFAEQDIELVWTVASVQWNNKLGGMVGQLDGTASVRHSRPSVIARGTILVKLAD
jgi:acyl dehydratase